MTGERSATPVFPEFWRKKPTVVDAREKLGEFLRALDVFLSEIGLSGGPAA